MSKSDKAAGRKARHARRQKRAKLAITIVHGLHAGNKAKAHKLMEQFVREFLKKDDAN